MPPQPSPQIVPKVVGPTAAVVAPNTTTPAPQKGKGVDAASLYTCTPRTIRRHIETILRAGRVPFIRSSPGMGKSSIVAQTADNWNLALIDHRVSTSAPEDFTGLPRFNDDGTASFHPFADLFPIEGTPLPEGKDGWLIFLDEMNSAPKSVQAASYKLVLDRMVGQHKLHPNVMIAAAGNLDTDKAIVNALSTAMKSRLVHLTMEISHEEWLKDVAFKNNYDERVISYLNYKPSALMDFNPDSKEDTFCCPRTWEFVNDILGTMGTGGTISAADAALFAGTITSGVAVDFIQFTNVFSSMVKISDVVADPKKCAIPDDTATRYAVTCHLMERVDTDNFSKVAEYMARFDMTFRILFFRSVIARNPELRSERAFSDAMVALSKYLNDD